MAYIELHRKALKQNFEILNKLFKESNIEWAIVTKLLCGNELLLKEVLDLDCKEYCDSRISNLRELKSIDSGAETVYIKPPAKKIIPDIIKYADASFNTELKTIQWLSKEAQNQNKHHKIIIMIELGDLREGVMGDELLNFYKQIFDLPNISVTGIGTNLNCLSGVYPSPDKLIQLSLYKQLIEAIFKRKIPWVTGGTSVVIPLIYKKQLPKGINHFRVGETLYFGKDLTSSSTIQGMTDKVIKLCAQIIEIHEKPIVPTGYIGANPSGEQMQINESDFGKKTFRAIIDLGVLDISKPDFLLPLDERLEMIGASSDMLVIDLGEADSEYKVGDYISFQLTYMGALRAFNSDYIEKRVV
jgi:predicted amino acid racemase